MKLHLIASALVALGIPLALLIAGSLPTESKKPSRFVRSYDQTSRIYTITDTVTGRQFIVLDTPHGAVLLTTIEPASPPSSPAAAPSPPARAP